jgi:hypothetical protein
VGRKLKYRSKFEGRVGKELEDAGVKFEYEVYSYEYEEPLRKNMARCAECNSTLLVRVGWYTPDFFLDNGVIIEAKGRWTAADRRKMLAIEKAHGLGIKMLFMRDNRIHKNSSTFYSDWCMQNNMDFAIGQVPKEWYSE